MAAQYVTVTVPLTGLLAKARSVLDSIAAQRANATPPPLVLNKHCVECEYQSRCRQIAIEKDDLSLLAKMTEKERRKQHDRGIFTVNQLSYTFRPRKRSAPEVMKHQHALTALAIRKKQIHILGTPALSAAGTPVYFDVEGDPDRDFYYLIGLRTKSVGSPVHYSFWANDPGDEQDMWADCLHRLSVIDNPRLIHYGSYETQFLKRMRTRYPNIGNPVFLDQLTKSALNLLSPIYAHVYFPTYSNSLKEVARYLGFGWSDSTSSGLTARHLEVSVGDLTRSQPETKAGHLQFRRLRGCREGYRSPLCTLPDGFFRGHTNGGRRERGLIETRVSTTLRRGRVCFA